VSWGDLGPRRRPAGGPQVPSSREDVVSTEEASFLLVLLTTSTATATEATRPKRKFFKKFLPMQFQTPPRTPARMAAAVIAGTARRLSVGQRYARSYTKTMIKRKRTQPSRTFNMKKYIRSTLPAKHHYVQDLQVTGTHNTVYTFSPTQGVVQGTGNAQRLGDSAHLLTLKVSGWASSSAITTKAVEYRIMVIYSGEEITAPTSLVTPSFASSELWLSSTAPGWAPNAISNPKGITVLDDRTITLNNSITGVSDLESFNYNVALNSDFDYQASASTFGKNRNLYIVVMGAILDGIAGSTAWGITNISTDLVFK